MMNNKALLFLIFCVALLKTTLASREFDVYRLVAYEQNGKQFGSKVSSFSLVGTHFSGDLLRKLALIHLSELSEENLNNLFAKKPSGLLIILPKEQIGENEASLWGVVSENLINRSTQIPVYFCEENEAIRQFYEKSKSAGTGEKSSRQIIHDFDANMNVIVTAPEPKLLKSVALDDFFGVLDENTPTTRISATSSPVILVVASYDSFTYVPDAKLGLNQFSSGAIALLNIAKQLSEFAESNKEISHNVIFFLTSSRTFNYEGFETWLNKAENSRIVNRIEYALFLDSLAGRNTLNLNVYNSNQETNTNLPETFKALEDTSRAYGVKTQLIQTNDKIFAGKFPVIKITDSNVPAGRAPTEWSGSANFNLEVFKRNLAFITEFLTNSVYGIKRSFQIIDSNHLNQEFLSASLRLFESKSTFPPQITKDSIFTQELFRAFSEVVKHPYRNTYSYGNIQFYTTAKARAKLTRISSAFFDFYLFLGNVAWLSVLYFLLSTKKTEQSPVSKKDDTIRRSKSPRKTE